MHRVGLRRAATRSRWPRRSRRAPSSCFEGLATHLAVADEPDRAYTDAQLDALRRRDRRRSPLAVGRPRSCTPRTRPGCSRSRGPATTSCASASPSTASTPVADARHRVASAAGALAPRSGLVREAAPTPARACRTVCGTSCRVAARIVTVPVGYADGVPRALGAAGGEVLVGGRRCPIAGTVTMDQLLVDVGDLDVARRRRRRAPRCAGRRRRSPPTSGPHRLDTIPTRWSPASAAACPPHEVLVVIELVPELLGRGVGLGAGALAAGAGGSPSTSSPRGGPAPPRPRHRAARSRPVRRGPPPARARRRLAVHRLRTATDPRSCSCTASAMTSRIWTKQFRDAAAGRASARSRSTTVGTARPRRSDRLGTDSIDQLADDVRAVVEGLDLRDAVIVGHSMGGHGAAGVRAAPPRGRRRARPRHRLVSTGARLDLPGSRSCRSVDRPRSRRASCARVRGLAATGRRSPARTMFGQRRGARVRSSSCACCSRPRPRTPSSRARTLALFDVGAPPPRDHGAHARGHRNRRPPHHTARRAAARPRAHRRPPRVGRRVRATC